MIVASVGRFARNVAQIAPTNKIVGMRILRLNKKTTARSFLPACQ
jgi:hypothetical protein